ncbi:hypothetical protein F1D05_31990 [Kribbella qitaiheensis]|uniref:Uncharacterized protein n=1 Tax=Kribbella qitaiheensis TaxID=1544730 RepID=A0A7G6X634_9ACTN|nr:hypothetical protein [Kribbella qitaiheensis]QNE21699.1 hypothetical protein F1D05_31990 [Kribbella qitaiheensis]
MSPWRRALATGLLAVLAGCGGPTAGPGTPDDSAPTGTFAEPSIEPTDPESSQQVQPKPSIELASAPIGGNVVENGIYRCAEVNWLGRSPIPAGTTIVTGSPHVEPGGVFEIDQRGCPADARPCPEVQWVTGDFQPCFVGARQVAAGTDDIALIMPIRATCNTGADCKSLAGDQPGSQIAFSPGDLPTTSPTG